MKLPTELENILKKLSESGFEAFIVGGCVRDLKLGREPKDWDVTTNAKPEQIQEIFPDSFYENTFGTVGVKTRSEEETLKVVEVTTYRIESDYSDKRHPDEVRFATKLEDDLRRRDFTINAIAMGLIGEPVDMFGGAADLEKKLIRAVGEPSERFNEDALRMMRAVRLATELGFEIEAGTLEAIKESSGLLGDISKERVRDEFIRLIDSDNADRGIEALRETGLLEYVMPELLEGVGVSQNKHHVYDVWEHNLKALKYAADQKYSIEIRIASLLHDAGKPRSKRGEGLDATFYGHQIISARMTERALKRLKFPSDQIDQITKLVRWHMFYYNVGEVTESSVRRLVANIGKENVDDLIKLREADRIGSDVPKAKPYKLRHLQFMIDKVARDPISPRMLKIDGNDIMSILGVKPGPKVGLVISALMNEVLDDPKKNDTGYLTERASELSKLSEAELIDLARAGKEKTAEKEEEELWQIKKKHKV